MGPAFSLHADDIGLSPGITAAIVKSIEEGAVRSVSLIVNGTGVDEAVRALSDWPDVRVSVHLNLLEGNPLSAPGNIPLLVDGEGKLATTFGRLMRLWFEGDRRRRVQLSEQMSREFAAQIGRGRAALKATGRPADRLRIDSHTHIHALGFVLDAVLACCSPGEIAYVRVPREPWHIGKGPRDWRAALGVNAVKWGLLNNLSRNMVRKLEARGIAFNPGFLGVLHTGRMTVSAIEAGIRAIQRTPWHEGCAVGGDPIEVLLHPGKARPEERDQWRERPELFSYYSSVNRDLEAKTTRDLSALPSGRFLGTA